VVRTVIKEAIANHQIDKVKLVKLGKPSDLADDRKWVEKGADARIELRISAAERGKRLAGSLVERAFGGDAAAHREIVRFDGIEFDQAKIEVVFPSGAHRTFNLERPDAGHPFTEDITLATAANGDPTDASIFAELDRVLEDAE
jgi:hypothetical protein